MHLYCTQTDLLLSGVLPNTLNDTLSARNKKNHAPPIERRLYPRGGQDNGLDADSFLLPCHFQGGVGWGVGGGGWAGGGGGGLGGRLEGHGGLRTPTYIAGAHKWAEMLHHPYILGGPQQRGQNQNWLPHSCFLGGPKEGGNATSTLRALKDCGTYMGKKHSAMAHRELRRFRRAAVHGESAFFMDSKIWMLSPLRMPQPQLDMSSPQELLPQFAGNPH